MKSNPFLIVARPTARAAVVAVLVGHALSGLLSTSPALAQGEPVAAQAAAPTASAAIAVAGATTAADRYRARMREAIAPILAEPVSDEDKANIKAAAIAIGRGEISEFAAIKAKIADPVGRKLADWYRLQRGLAAPDEAAAFLAANPEWPDEDTIRRRMEEGLFLRPPKPDAVIALFAKAPPALGPGRAALAAALLAKGDTEGARRLAVTAWRGDQIPDSIETAFLERLGSLLGEADHKWRFDVILGEDRRWASERRGRAADARRVVALLSPGEQAKARARIAVYLRDKAGAKLLRGVLSGQPEAKAGATVRAKAKPKPGDEKTDAKRPDVKQPLGAEAKADAAAPGANDPKAGAEAEAKSAAARKAAAAAAASDWGLQLQHVQLLRREKNRSEAARILQRAPVDPAVVASLDGWWAARQGVALELLAAGDANGAYALVRDAGPLSVNPAKDQAFLAGHLALRHRRDTAAAIRHFTAMRKAADGPLSRSKAEFWLAKAQAAAGDAAAAAAHYRRGATYLDTFDGQLSRLAAYPGERRLEVPLPDAPSDADIARFRERDAVRAARLAMLSGFTRRNAMTFFARLSHRLTNEAELAMLGEMARALGDTQVAVRIGKAAVARGRKLYLYAYPVDVLPAYEPLREPPEPAMLLAIGRQETEFNSQIMSGAGARGLLQVMPITARHVCRDYRVSCSVPKLMSDAAYNVKLASAYIADRTDEFAGSYILTLTGYNAGPGRTREWLRRLGDPRAGVDPLDWINSIPFEETRLYVQKVLSNLQVYRSLIGERDPLRLDLDLKRVRPAAKRAAPTSAAPAPE